MKKSFFRNTIIIISLIIYSLFLSSCDPKSHIQQEFNAQNQVIKETMYIRGVLFSTTEYKYNSDGNKSHEIHYDENGIQTYYETFEYNSKNQKIKETLYKDGKMFVESTMSYNDKGLMIRSDNLTYQGGRSYNLYFYDENNNEIERKQYVSDSEGDELRFWHKSTYTEDGNIEQEIEYDKNENIINVTKYIYNKKGKLKKICEYDASGNVKATRNF